MSFIGHVVTGDERGSSENRVYAPDWSMDATLDVRIGRVLGPQIVTTTVAIANTVRQKAGTGGPLLILAMAVGHKSKRKRSRGP